MILKKSTNLVAREFKQKPLLKPTKEAEISISTPNQQTKNENEQNKIKATSSMDVNMTSPKSTEKGKASQKKDTKRRILEHATKEVSSEEGDKQQIAKSVEQLAPHEYTELEPSL